MVNISIILLSTLLHCVIEVYTLKPLYFMLLHTQNIPTSSISVKFDVWYIENIHKPVVICGFYRI